LKQGADDYESAACGLLAEAGMLMSTNLVELREAAMDRADRALNAVWPQRTGAEYVREMQAAEQALKDIAKAMAESNTDPVEQSKVYRYLGSIHSDLAPALGHDELLEAKALYEKSEALLEGCSDPLERAKLNFNYANTLRQVDPDNADLLTEAKQRILAAKEVFEAQAPQHLPSVRQALQSVNLLLELSPLIRKVTEQSREMEGLQQELAAGGDLASIAERTRELTRRDGGIPAMVLKLQQILDGLPEEMRQTDQFAAVTRMLDEVKEQCLGGGDEGEALIIGLLKRRLEKEIKSGKVDEERARTLRGLVEQIELQMR
jgi:hypothetical protein